MRTARLVALLLPLLAIAQAGCPTERMPPAKEAMPPEDEWSKMAPTKEWLFATSEFNGPHKAECDHVLGWVKGEESCKASLCEHGASLANDWLQRCTPLEDPGLVSSVRTVQAALSARASEKPTDCARRLGDIVRDGCGDDATCQATGQRWATRCAKSEATPLVMRILQRTIERKLEQGAEPVKLDVRTCDELRVEVMDRSKCKDRFACAELIPRIDAYRDRCESESERPTLATAVAEATVLMFGSKPPEPILLAAGAPSLQPGQLPVMLEDKSGGVITVCDERASDLARYIGTRKGCQGGRMVVARAFPTPRGAEVRVGSLDFPDDATFSARYPTIVAAGELDARDKEAAAALDAELGKAAELARSAAGAPEAAKIVSRAVLANVLSIKRSAAVRAVLARRDEALAPALREIAKEKIAASRGKISAPESAGLLLRARTRVFADLAPDGSVQIGAASRAFTLDTAAFLPRATEAYATVLKGARPKKVDAKTAKAEKARGQAAAQACGSALRKLSETKKALASCNFGLEACDDAKTAGLVKTVDEARVAAERAYHELEEVRTGGAADEADALTRAAEAAACREPWW
ncbi:MAG: hypothetical protein QM820_11120 [Minicystis sp.]